jgi:hypothetical protein
MQALCASHKKALIFTATAICALILLTTLHGGLSARNMDLLLYGSLDASTVRTPQLLMSHMEHDTMHWGDQPVPPTRIVAHAPGWTIFDRLYVREGTIYIVTDYPELVPPHNEITSTGQMVGDGGNNLPDLEPTDAEIRTISTEEARELFGEYAIKMEGVTVSIARLYEFVQH